MKRADAGRDCRRRPARACCSSHLLARQGIDSIVVEDRSRDYVEDRVRAGVLEQGTVDTLDRGRARRPDDGGGPRPRRHRDPLRRRGPSHRLPVADRRQADHGLWPERGGEGPDRRPPRRRRRHPLRGRRHHASTASTATARRSATARTAREHEIACDFIAGCDGFHGICRPSIPEGALTGYDRVYPYAWLGILADSTPPSDEVAYCHSERGFALLSLRSPTRQPPLPPGRSRRGHRRLAGRALLGRTAAPHRDRRRRRPIEAGPVLQKGITPMRSFVAEPMRHGRLFLAGDAAHIVPPTGAKGMNLAVADIRYPDRGAGRLLPHGRHAPASTAIRPAACAGSGRPSAFRGG